jgi:hypothetical protein
MSATARGRTDDRTPAQWLALAFGVVHTLIGALTSAPVTSRT